MYTLRYRPSRLALLLPLLLAAPAGAADLSSALVAARANSPELAAQAARLEAAGDQLDVADARRLPHLSLEGSAGMERIEGTSSVFPFQDLTLNPAILGLRFEQPLYASGSISAGIEAARFGQAAQQATFGAAEQAVLLDAVTAYADVYRDQSLLALERNNEQRLRKRLEAATAERKAGERTGTDVAQARARLAGAEAGRIAAEGALAASEAGYLRAIGEAPDALEAPSLPANVPATLAAAIELAQRGFQVEARRAAQRMAQAEADAVDGEDGLQVALTASASHASEPDLIFERRDQAAIALTFSMPLYQGGGGRARERAAHREATARQLEAEATLRQVREQAARAWQGLLSTRAKEKAIEAQILAAREALEGVQAATRAGERTLLDTLDAEQELLQAKTDAVEAARDHVVAAYTLMAVTGQLTLAKTE